MKFSLILASRERLELLQALLESIEKTTKEKQQIEVLVAIDNDDIRSVRLASYLENRFKEINLKFIVRPRSEYMHRDYINYAYRMSSGKYLIVLNDDTLFVKENWDDSYYEIEEYLLDKPDNIVCGATENFTNLFFSCFPLVSRAAADAVGFFMPNEKKGWGADSDLHALYSHPSVNRIIKLPNIQIKHVSYHVNARPKDKINFRMEEISRTSSHFPVQHYAEKLAHHLNKKQIKNTKNKVLAVYNICGISGKENLSYYCKALHSVVNQKFDNFRVVVSGCMTSSKVKETLQDYFKQISFNWIDSVQPLGITFNHSVLKSVEKYGDFVGYLYIDSGIVFDNEYTIQKMYDLLSTSSMVASQVDTDHGYDIWKIQWNRQSDYIVPLGKTANLHCQMFSHKILESYGKILPDIFASDTSESIFPYMCAAIKERFIISKEVSLHHEPSMDGASSGFRYKAPLLIHSPEPIEQLCREGRRYGFGYEECRNICPHDPRKFRDGFALDNRLYKFIKEKMFIKENVFSYKNIPYSYIQERNYSTDIPSPAITCILVSHNKPNYVKEAIQSILDQTFSDWQGVLIDSGVLYDQGFFNYLSDSRLNVVRSDETDEMRKSMAMAPYCFNHCLKRFTKGFLVMYLCDDDILYPNAFETFVNYYKENPNVYCMYASQDLITIENDGTRLWNGERRAMDKMGRVVGRNVDCVLDYCQMCHRYDILNFLPHKTYWSESKETEHHADGIFMESLGNIVPFYPIDIKISQNRRTPESVAIAGGGKRRGIS